jgi:hypothetical protein
MRLKNASPNARPAEPLSSSTSCALVLPVLTLGFNP